MKIWTIANQKGGVGKTTTAVTLGGLLAGPRRRVLLVDMDPHGSMTYYFGYDPDSIQHSVYEWFLHEGTLTRDQLLQLVLPTAEDNLFLIPASMALATLDRQLGGEDGKGLVVVEALKQLENDFEMVLLDCPPVLGVLMVNALAACEHLLMPVQTEFLALQGLERMVRSLALITQARNLELPYTIVPTLFDRRTRACIDALRQLRDKYDDLVWPSVIPVDTRLRDASQAHITPARLAPESRGVDAYKRLLKYLIKKVRD